MVDVIDLGGKSPLKALKAEFEAKLAEKDRELAALREELKDNQVTIARVRGINDLLKLQLADLSNTLDGIGKAIQHVTLNVKDLKTKLPDDI